MVGLALGPLVAVEPDLGRIRKVGADLDEARPEVRVEDVEVVDADAALLAEELKPHGVAGGAVAGAEDPLELLAGHDRHDPEASLTLGRLQVGADVVELAVIPTRPVRLLERRIGIPWASANRLTSRRKRLPMLPSSAADGIGLPRCPVMNRADLTADLQIRHVRVEVQPIDAVDLERDMTVERRR